MLDAARLARASLFLPGHQFIHRRWRLRGVGGSRDGPAPAAQLSRDRHAVIIGVTFFSAEGLRAAGRIRKVRIRCRRRANVAGGDGGRSACFHLGFSKRFENSRLTNSPHSVECSPLVTETR